MTDNITDREFTAIISDCRGSLLTADTMLHLEDGGTLTQEQRERAEKLNNCASNAMEGLIGSLKGVGALMARSSINNLEQSEAINVTWLVSTLGDLVNAAYLLEVDTRDILQRSELNEMKGAVRAVARISEARTLEASEGSSVTEIRQ
ncbi:hypothetical protein [Thiohalobacter thiocyanaticus]|uniref:Uncharacterized protein n=1 Tax=Thiohalobacter thiocyanaticus TaxID=585455 RepID=A0A426QG24_9GAMM|nr:hypothetical protein [Thiohalobacter thiocyanaticus]RRQ20705.1 hypothetical protein D6C00_01030 [Thiohalobacter thiocyanaticus]